jgi:hypothetical protein
MSVHVVPSFEPPITYDSALDPEISYTLIVLGTNGVGVSIWIHSPANADGVDVSVIDPFPPLVFVTPDWGAAVGK